MGENNFVYEFEGSLYINLTNKCYNDCVFCVRKGGDFDGKNLFLEREPEANEVIALLKKGVSNKSGKLINYRNALDIVFCGYGEPTHKLDVLLEVAKFLKKKKLRYRLTTNGLGNAINGRDITYDLAMNFRRINISLNAPTEEAYDRICKSSVPKAYEELQKFTYSCYSRCMDITFSVVGCFLSEEELEHCRAIASDLNAGFKNRELM